MGSVRVALRPSSVRHALVLVTGLTAALPVIGSTARQLADGWVPQSDQAVAVARAYDVFTSWTPLVGPWSSTSHSFGEPVHHLGPLLYWLLALPARLPGSAALPLTMGLVNSAAVIGAVALAHRRGGRPLMFATGAAIAAMCASIETESLADIWNPSAPLLPFTLLIFVCWSVACGEPRLLPLAVVLASFVVQCHLSYVLPALALMAVAVAGLIASRGAAPPGGSLRRWSVVAVVVGAVCWSGPVIDQALSWAGSSRGTGNLETVVRAARARESPVGVAGGARSVASAVGVAPQWLRAPQTAEKRTFEIFAPVGALRAISAFAVLGGLVLVVVAGRRRGRTDVVAAASLALLLCAALAAVTAAFPNTPVAIFSYSYACWWAIPTGMFAWLALGWSASTLWPPSFERWARAFPSPAAAGMGLAVVATVAMVAVVSQRHDGGPQYMDQARTVAEGVSAALPDPGRVRVDAEGFEFRTTVIQALRRSGGLVQTKEFVEFGRDYALRGGPVDHVIDIRLGREPPPGARIVAQVEMSPGAQTVTVSSR